MDTTKIHQLDNLPELLGTAVESINQVILGKQQQIKLALTCFIAQGHCLIEDQPGVGKTTLAQIVARELGVGFRATSGPVIARAGDLAAILTMISAMQVFDVIQVMTEGFLLHDRLLRPAQVGVSSTPAG